MNEKCNRLKRFKYLKDFKMKIIYANNKSTAV